VSMLPKTIHEPPSGKQLWEAFDRVSVDLYKKQQKLLLAKKRKKVKSVIPPADEDEALKEIDEFFILSLPDGWMYQKGYPEKLLLSMKICYKSKVFQRSSADGGEPKQSRKEIRKENYKQKLQEFADGRNDIYRQEVAKKQKVARQKANSSTVEANSIHRMSVSMAQNTQSDILKDHMAMFVQGKEFFSPELPTVGDSCKSWSGVACTN
jgi:hypothetical protein